MAVLVCPLPVWSQEVAGSSPAPQPASAAPVNEQKIHDLIRMLEAQNARLAKQADDIARQQRELQNQRAELEKLRYGLAPVPGPAPNVQDPFNSVVLSTQRPLPDRDATRIHAAGVPKTAASAPPRPTGHQTAQSEAAPTTPGSDGGAADQRSRPQDLDILANVGGVLTPRGRLVIEPQFEYSHTSLNRFFFQGVEIVDAVLIGVIEATDSDRDTLTPGLGVRYGVTNRFEVDARATYVMRDDRVTNTEISTGTNNIQALTGKDIGDVEVGAHYQINQGGGQLPYLVGNLRVKTTTGTGPFDVARDANGIETELATGSGFWAIEPSISFVHQTDPAVLFGNIGYLWNIGDDIGEVIGGARVGEVDPGDSINASFGIGIALNERTSISLGYQHSYVLGTSTELNGIVSKSNSLQVGSFLFGVSYGITDNIGVNVNLAAGLTEDAPDARISVRVPIAFSLLE